MQKGGLLKGSLWLEDRSMEAWEGLEIHVAFFILHVACCISLGIFHVSSHSIEM
jgi:hypothetical protein